MKICLITSGHLGTDPRCVKEADALQEAGYDVHVISCDYFEEGRSWDQHLRESRTWDWTSVSLQRGTLRYAARRLRQMACRTLFVWGFQSLRVAEAAHHPGIGLLKKITSQISADLYIGHCLAALPVVVKAARVRSALAGFDAEDLHSEEADDSVEGRRSNQIAGDLERHYLQQVHHLTAASPLIAAALRERYHVKPETILNVFPKPQSPPPKQELSEECRFYWFSQTIGPARGLEEFSEICKKAEAPMGIDLRGRVSAEYRETLLNSVAGSQVKIQFLAPEPPDQMIKCAFGYTAGLALERKHPQNRDLCLTNKAFTYLLAGIPVILSNTRAQSDLKEELAAAALLIDLDKIDESANQLKQWISCKKELESAHERARLLGQERYHWDVEKEAFLKKVEEVLRTNGKN